MSSIGPSFGTPEQKPFISAQPGNAAEVTTEEDGLNVLTVSLPGSALINSGLLTPQQIQSSTVLTPQQWLLLLRNLLHLPSEITQLLLLLAKTENATPELTPLLNSLLSDNPSISLQALQLLLKDKLSQAQDKLIKLTQGQAVSLKDPQGHTKGSLLGSLAELSQKTEKSPLQALHSALTLYLTAYPLPPPQTFFLQFKTPSGFSEETGGSMDPTLIIFIETITLGLFRIVLVLAEQQSHWEIDVEHDARAAEFTEAIQKNLEMAIQETLIQPHVFRWFFHLKKGPGQQYHDEESAFEEVSQEAIPLESPFLSAKPSSNGQPEKASIGLYSGNKISLREILLAYQIIRVILELDQGQI